MSSDGINEFAKSLWSLADDVLKRAWYALSKEKIIEKKVEAVRDVFLSSLENKKFEVKSGKVSIPMRDLEREPKEMISQLRSELDKIK